MQARVLIVEDDKLIRPKLERRFKASTADLKKRGVNWVYDVQSAATADEAREKIKRSREQRTPFDLLLLDLGLPELNPVEEQDQRDVGLRLLMEICGNAEEPRKVGAIVVASAYSDKETLTELIHSQAVQDFIEKPWDESADPPFFRATEVFINWCACEMRSSWTRHRMKLIERWIPTSIQAGQLRWITVRLQEGVGVALNRLNELQSRIEEQTRLSFEFDRESAVVRQTLELRSVIAEIVQSCGLGRSLSGDAAANNSGDLREFDVTAVVRRAGEDLRCGLFFRNVELEQNGESLLTDGIEGDVSRIVEECLFGAIDTCRRGGKVVVDVRASEFTNDVIIRDQSPSLAQDQDAVNRAEPIGEKGGRGWGLALAQFVALNLGARLELQTGVDADGTGNIVTLKLPRYRS